MFSFPKSLLCDRFIDSQCLLCPQCVPAIVPIISSCATTAAALTSRTPATAGSTVQIAQTKTSAQTVRTPLLTRRRSSQCLPKMNTRVTFFRPFSRQQQEAGGPRV